MQWLLSTGGKRSEKKACMILVQWDRELAKDMDNNLSSKRQRDGEIEELYIIKGQQFIQYVINSIFSFHK